MYHGAIGNGSSYHSHSRAGFFERVEVLVRQSMHRPKVTMKLGTAFQRSIAVSTSTPTDRPSMFVNVDEPAALPSERRPKEALLWKANGSVVL